MLRRTLNLAPDGAVAAPPATVTPPATAPPATPPASKAVEGDPFAGLEAEISDAGKPPAAAAPPADKGTPPPDKGKKLDPLPSGEPQTLEEAIKDQKTFQKLPANFRKFATKAHEDNKTLTEKIASLERIVAIKEKEGQDTSKITARIADLEKQLSERDGTIRALKQEASPEFKAKYDVPFDRAGKFTRQNFEGMEWTERDATGNPTVRAATWKDFQGLYALPINKASQIVRQTMGDNAPWVIGQLTKLQEMDYERGEALKEEQANFKTRQDKEVADQKLAAESENRMWTEAYKAIEESDPLFQPDPKDTKAAGLLKQGYQIWDSVSNPQASGMTPVQRAVAAASLRSRAASQPVLKYHLAVAKARIAELEAKLKGNTEADPNEATLGSPGGQGSAKEPEGFLDGLKEAISD
jgi:hypothetical protein